MPQGLQKHHRIPCWARLAWSQALGTRVLRPQANDAEDPWEPCWWHHVWHRVMGKKGVCGLGTGPSMFTKSFELFFRKTEMIHVETIGNQPFILWSSFSLSSPLKHVDRLKEGRYFKFLISIHLEILFNSDKSPQQGLYQLDCLQRM